MIHRLSRFGGALCNAESVPFRMKRPESGEVYVTMADGEKEGDTPVTCSKCETMYAYELEAIHAKAVLPKIVSAEIQCPRCNRFHVDREEWYHKFHHEHRCEHCGHDFEFVPDPHHKYSRGIEPVSVHGRLTVLRHMFADWLYERLS